MVVEALCNTGDDKWIKQMDKNIDRSVVPQ